MNKPMIFAVLDDGETFGAAHNSSILIGPDSQYLTQFEADALENGELPDTWFDPSMRERPAISFTLLSNGDLVAHYHGFGEQRDATSLVLADAETLSRLA